MTRKEKVNVLEWYCDYCGNTCDTCELKNMYEGFSKSIDKGMEVFGNNFCRKFTNGSYDSRFNRAVFDVLSYVLGHDQALKAVDKDEQGLRLAYEEACSFPEFIKSVESSTKNIEPTKQRFGIFIDCFNLFTF